MHLVIIKQHYKYPHKQPEAVHIVCTYSLDRETI